MNNISSKRVKRTNKINKRNSMKYKRLNQYCNNTILLIIIMIMISFFIFMYLYKKYCSSKEGYELDKVNREYGYNKTNKKHNNNNKINLKIVLELVRANNYEDRQHGLMFRKVPLHERQQEYNYHSQTQINDKKKLKEYNHLIKFKQGMLFDYGENKVISMWMKNTFIPLDIIFLDNDYKVIHYHKNATPHSLKGLSSKKDAYYAIELNAGSIDDLNISVGDNIKEWIKIIDELD